uniref:Uncharacterized protein n=1 Tax=Arundo donax TaxID=35708 RepID=A0A0A9AXD9_ARUDO
MHRKAWLRLYPSSDWFSICAIVPFVQ